MSSDNEIKFIIASVINLNSKYQEIKKIRGENFNIFSILRLERNEFKTHSNFIFELLNHQGSHNQGNLFLKLFLEQVLQLSDYGNIEKVKAHQEYLTKKHRKIDFVIETEKYQIGIEMKIDAKDQDMQLADYMIELKRAKKIEKLYYLTLNGKEASEDSIGDNEINYTLLSFEDDIYNWIITCIEKSASTPLLREGLTHYKNLIATITNKISQPMEKEMEQLIKTPKEIEAAQIILNEYPKIWAKKEMQFWNELWNVLDEKLTSLYIKNKFQLIDFLNIWIDENGEEFDENNIIKNIIKKREKKNKYVGFYIEKEYKNIGSFTFKVVEWGNNIELNISFYDYDENEIIMPKELSDICENIGFTGTQKPARYVKIENTPTFYGRYQTNPTYDLFDDDRFNFYIKHVSEQVFSKIVLLIKNERIIKKALSV